MAIVEGYGKALSSWAQQMYSPTTNMVGVDHGSLEHPALTGDNTHTQV